MPKPAPLTAAALRTIKPPERGQQEHADGACPGLRLRVSQGGAATWVLGCRDREGRARRFKLGDFPAMGLGEARKAARVMRGEVRAEGKDPIREAQEARQRAWDARQGVVAPSPPCWTPTGRTRARHGARGPKHSGGSSMCSPTISSAQRRRWPPMSYSSPWTPTRRAARPGRRCATFARC